MTGQDARDTTGSVLELRPVWLMLGLTVLALLAPQDLIRKLDFVGYAVCHRIAERSFFIAGNQLPVCARDTGMFIGCLVSLLTIAVLPGRRAAGFPRVPFVLVMGLFFAAWAFDGFNSYMKLLLGRAPVYEPQNWLRLTTGAFMGASLGVFVAPLFNQAVWRPELALDEPGVKSWRDVARVALIALAVIGLVLWQPPFLYAPIALFSGLGALTLLTVVNGLLLLIAVRRAQTVQRWRELALPMLAGAVLTGVEISAIALLRASLTQSFGLPF